MSGADWVMAHDRHQEITRDVRYPGEVLLVAGGEAFPDEGALLQRVDEGGGEVRDRDPGVGAVAPRGQHPVLYRRESPRRLPNLTCQLPKPNVRVGEPDISGSRTPNFGSPHHNVWVGEPHASGSEPHTPGSQPHTSAQEAHCLAS